MASDYNKSQMIVAVLGFAGVLVSTVSSNWDKLFPQSALTPPAISIPLGTPAPPDTIPAPDTLMPRLTPTPRVTPMPSVTPTPRIAPSPPDAALPRVTPVPSATPTLPATTASITSPRPGASVGQKIAVEGLMPARPAGQHVFLCVKSQAFGRLIYPQGLVIPDDTGHWTVESIYATPGYRYETFLVRTTNPASAAMLRDPQARKYGLRSLPPGTEPLGPVVVVTRE